MLVTLRDTDDDDDDDDAVERVQSIHLRRHRSDAEVFPFPDDVEKIPPPARIDGSSLTRWPAATDSAQRRRVALSAYRRITLT